MLPNYFFLKNPEKGKNGYFYGCGNSSHSVMVSQFINTKSVSLQIERQRDEKAVNWIRIYNIDF